MARCRSRIGITRPVSTGNGVVYARDPIGVVLTKLLVWLVLIALVIAFISALASGEPWATAALDLHASEVAQLRTAE